MGAVGSYWWKCPLCPCGGKGYPSAEAAEADALHHKGNQHPETVEKDGT